MRAHKGTPPAAVDTGGRAGLEYDERQSVIDNIKSLVEKEKHLAEVQLIAKERELEELADKYEALRASQTEVFGLGEAPAYDEDYIEARRLVNNLDRGEAGEGDGSGASASASPAHRQDASTRARRAGGELGHVQMLLADAKTKSGAAMLSSGRFRSVRTLVLSHGQCMLLLLPSFVRLGVRSPFFSTNSTFRISYLCLYLVSRISHLVSRSIPSSQAPRW